MIDAPSRKEPRFPPAKEGLVRREIAGQLSTWKADASDLAISGGACGADILFAEGCLERGVRVLLLIALPEDAFLKKSVAFAGADWEARYRALRATCETRLQHEALGPPARGEDAFERNNRWRIEVARSLVPPERIHTLLVWDERTAGGGRGGTADFAARVAESGGGVSVINPTKL